jgi:chemotaxis protein CheX
MSTAALFEKHKDYFLINLPSVLDSQTCKTFDDQIAEFHDGHVIINCGNQTFIPKDWLRALLKIHLNLKSEGKSMKLIHANPMLTNHLKQEGVNAIFGIAKDLKDALLQLGCLTKKSMDIEFVDPFLTATIHVLKIQATVKASAGKISLKKAGVITSGDISGIIGVVSDTFNGSVIISFPEATFLAIMSSMLGETYTTINKDIVDGAGELTNIIFGQAKITLNEKGYGINTAIPSVVSGKNHILSAQTKGPVVVVPFESSAGPFVVEICME